MFTADQVWGAAVAAHRINDGYFKEDVWMMNATPPYRDKTANKSMVKQWLAKQDFSEITAADIEQGQRVRQHFQSYLFLQLSGKIKPFQASALLVANKDEFGVGWTTPAALISCLPHIMLKDRLQKDLMAQISNSEQLTGEPGSIVQGTARIIKSWYSQEYGKYHLQATLNGSYVDFWFGLNLEVGSEHEIKGKIKNVRSDNTTQLNYVKKVLTKA